MTISNAELNEMKSELKRLNRKLETAFAHPGESLSHKASETIETLRDGLEDVLESTLDSTKDFGKKVNDYTEDNPWQVAMIALALGFIAGYMTNRAQD